MTKPISERMKIDSLLHLALRADYRRWKATGQTDTTFECPGCGLIIVPGQEIQWDHGVPDALGGEHTHWNIRPMHAECHKKKTFGTKATTAGSDIHMIRKAQRIAKGGKKRKGKKIPSKPFPKVSKRVT